MALLLCLLVLCGCGSNAPFNKGRKINSVNHRGFSAEAPENTLAAFRMSKQKGFGTVECDVRFTKDGVPVILHDKTVNRTSNGRGEVSDLTFDELLQLDFGSWKGEVFQGEKIPTFLQFLQLCQSLKLNAYVEVKEGASAEQVKQIYLMTEDFSVDITWISFEEEILRQLAELNKELRLGILTHFATVETLEFLNSLGVAKVFVDCCYTTLSARQIRRCEEANIPLEVWTVDSVRKITEIDPYISGVTSDGLNAQEIFDNL